MGENKLNIITNKEEFDTYMEPLNSIGKGNISKLQRGLFYIIYTYRVFFRNAYSICMFAKSLENSIIQRSGINLLLFDLYGLFNSCVWIVFCKLLTNKSASYGRSVNGFFHMKSSFNYLPEKSWPFRTRVRLSNLYTLRKNN